VACPTCQLTSSLFTFRAGPSASNSAAMTTATQKRLTRCRRQRAIAPTAASGSTLQRWHEEAQQIGRVTYHAGSVEVFQAA